MPTPAAPTAPSGARPVRPTRPAARAPLAERPALLRPRACAVSGVSAGLARHLGAPLWAVRALFVVLSGFLGAGILLYLWCWAFMPWEPASVGAATRSVPTRSAPVAWVLIGASILGALGVLIAIGNPYGYSWVVPVPMSPTLPLSPSFPLLLAASVTVAVSLAAAAGLWAALVDRADPNRGPRHATLVRVAAVGILVVVFLIPLHRVAYDGAATVLILLLPLLGILAVLSSTLIERFRELSGERVKRIREEQRAEMAAHLHDSVLQTLALIQNRAGASSDAARLARAQERELRAWLYDGDQPADSDLPTDLRDYAGALELDYPVRIDVVSAGLSTERASGELAAAAREAMLNAARHAGGEVSVYIEGGAAGVDVYVRDRGTGFDIDAVPADRLGIRQSLIGRMRRAGGAATIRSTDAGTEVHLHFSAHAEGGERG